MNDFVLKSAFHNQFTGKLSDFAGLFAFPFFWTAIFPNKRNTVHLSTFLLFIFWKSEFSQPFIDFANTVGFQAFRTVDYWDNIALISVGLSYFSLIAMKLSTCKPLLIKASIIVSLFSFVATTQKRGAPTYEDGFKTITIYNQGLKSLNVIVDFKYSAKEIGLDTGLNNKFNRLDTFSLKSGESSRFITPILAPDSIQFPASFRVLIIDSTGKKVNDLNMKSFLKASERDYNGQIPTSNSYEWRLKIGEKIPEKFQESTLYGRWTSDSTAGKAHTFEIRKDHYYDVNPDGEVLNYALKDSTISVFYSTGEQRARILHLKNKKLLMKWDGKKEVTYHKLYN